MRPRLCLATDSQEPSGVGEHMLALAEQLLPHYEIVLSCPHSTGGRVLLDRAASLGCESRQLDGGATTADWLRNGGFDILHIHAGIGWEGHDLAAQGRAAGIGRIIRTEHLPDLITDQDQRQAHRAGVALVDRVICVSEAAAATFRGAGMEAEKLTVIRNGLPEPVPRHSREAVRRSLDVSDHRVIILTIARFTPQKDHATLVSALPSVLDRCPDLALWLVGLGPLRETVQQQAETLGVADKVHFLGFRDDVPDLLGAADLFALPSRFEGLPLAVLEAMALGLPIVATRVGGTDEVVIDGQTGRLVDAGEPALLADALVSVADDRAYARVLGTAGRTRFRSEFTASRMAEETNRLYRGPVASAAS